MSRRDVLGTNPYTLKNGVAAPQAILGIHPFEDLPRPLVPRVNEKTIGLCQYGGPQEFMIPSKSGANAVTDSTEDAVDIRIDLLLCILGHGMFQGGWVGFLVEIEFHSSIVFEKSGEVDHQVSNDREVGERLDENGLS